MKELGPEATKVTKSTESLVLIVTCLIGWFGDVDSTCLICYRGDLANWIIGEILDTFWDANSIDEMDSCVFKINLGVYTPEDNDF